MPVDPKGLLLVAGAYRVRPIDKSDRAGIIRAGQSPTIGGRMPWFPSPFPDHYADSWLERALGAWQGDQHRIFSIVDGANAYVGSVVLSQSPDDSLTLAYWVLPECCGQGAATSGARAAIEWAASTLGIWSFIATARPENIASRRVLQKLGFREGEIVDGRFSYTLNYEP